MRKKEREQSLEVMERQKALRDIRLKSSTEKRDKLKEIHEYRKSIPIIRDVAVSVAC